MNKFRCKCAFLPLGKSAGSVLLYTLMTKHFWFGDQSLAFFKRVALVARFFNSVTGGEFCVTYKKVCVKIYLGDEQLCILRKQQK